MKLTIDLIQNYHFNNKMIKSILSKINYFPSLLIIFSIFCCQDISESVLTKDYGIVINEINYNSSDDFDSQDWIEIYNNSLDTVDISFWVIKDEEEDHIYTVPNNINMNPNDYLVFSSDLNAFSSFFPNVENYLGNLGFNLSGGSDAVRIYDRFEYLVDIVEYKDSNPWPSNADGNGPTLELINPRKDNSEPNNWNNSIGNGTPGFINSTFEIDG